jgi:hypothetical protein
VRVAIIIFCFIVGYYAVGRLIGWIKRQGYHGNDESRNSRRHHETTGNSGNHERWTTGTGTDQETKYRKILGLTKDDGIGDIKNKYREILSKYHPDKVQHLGPEFQELAETKTKEIVEAYQYFQKKYKS